MWQIYYNGDCSKARAAKAFLEDAGVDYQLINYLEAPLTAEMIQQVLAQLGVGIDGIIRTKEEAFKKIALEWFTWSEAEKMAYLLANPIIIERPIVIYQDRAVIARPDVTPIETLLTYAKIASA
ncbi:arsenate reductase [Ignatzschineria ureiclastica]|uniref:Arsenate reductase n=1 Tax=Ignatzschineria ureiclastica TaxID=472582 RepID=A0A2U2AFV7_9GAMM|nr:ArsC/Spx/MgsR family protein [Ignatzschineria ureiclastica]PWD81535.1 arsenate reductase [Ignatzschineria ureiclastica]GHA01453.1 arsenate reductase (glutaredoxin) [Ignatzschineria ureiclastica]